MITALRTSLISLAFVNCFLSGALVDSTPSLNVSFRSNDWQAEEYWTRRVPTRLRHLEIDDASQKEPPKGSLEIGVRDLIAIEIGKHFNSYMSTLIGSRRHDSNTFEILAYHFLHYFSVDKSLRVVLQSDPIRADDGTWKMDGINNAVLPEDGASHVLSHPKFGKIDLSIRVVQGDTRIDNDASPPTATTELNLFLAATWPDGSKTEYAFVPPVRFDVPFNESKVWKGKEKKNTTP